MNVKFTVFTLGFLLAAALPLFGHHAFAAEFDGSKAIRLSGSLTRIEWSNPHSYFYIDVTDSSGKVVTWGCEAASPGALIRRGFRRSDLKPGDTIVIDGYPARDGSHLMDARRITLSDGRIVSGGSAADGSPGAGGPDASAPGTGKKP